MTMLKPQDIRIGDYLLAADKVIDGGRCRVDNITFVWTQFYIELVNKKEY